VSLSASVFFQSVVKHLLSQADSMILASMASLEAQGIYSLASNYGGLVARILFQPIEESSRNMFSLLLSPSEANMRDTHTIGAAKSHLIDILRGYGILSAIILPVGPVLAPRAVHILGGRRWASPEVDGLLALYCYYIPFLAFNGITEAFVSSAASPADLRRHAGWMGAFSACFAVAAYVFLKIGGLGARGLVCASIVTMAFRLLWSCRFIKAYFRRFENDLALSDATLRLATVAVGMVSASIMPAGQERLGSDVKSVLTVLGFGAVYTLLV
jgi:oligosaccharide translocation protein RFT1